MKYENYPLPIILLTNMVSLGIYALGIYIFVKLGILYAVLYLIYILWFEVKLLKGSCVNCYYYGKLCSFGKGKLSSLLFKKGNPAKFIERKITWHNNIPDLFILIFPLAGGVTLLVGHFSWMITGVMACMIILSFAGNAFVRGCFACKYCKQRDLGCPAFQLFKS